MKKKILVGLLLAGSTMFAAPRLSFGIGFGGQEVEAPRVVSAVPPCPGPGYVFVDGYWRYGGDRDSRGDYYRGDDNRGYDYRQYNYRDDDNRRDDYRRDNDRRGSEQFNHFDQHEQNFRR
jgi:hypothetical protein